MTAHWAMAFVQNVGASETDSELFSPTFEPDRPLTRCEFAVVLAQYFDLPRPWGILVPDFADVTTHHGAIAKAVAMGFLVGYPDGTFRPQTRLKRFEMIAAFAQGLGLTQGNPSILKAFRDYAQIPTPVMGAIAAATQHYLVVNPYQSDLRPLQRTTWGEMVATLHQALVCQGRLPICVAPQIVDPLPYLSTFTDIQHHWAKPFIQAIANAGFIQGSAKGKFFPDHPLTRAEFAQWVQVMFNPAPQRPAKQFFDLSPGSPLAAAIQQSYRGGFLSGFPDQTFHPKQPLRRIHLLVDLAQGLGLPPGDLALWEQYTDHSEIPQSARGAVVATLKAGICLPELTLKPQAIATRAEGLIYCYQALLHLRRIYPCMQD